MVDFSHCLFNTYFNGTQPKRTHNCNYMTRYGVYKMCVTYIFIIFDPYYIRSILSLICNPVKVTFANY
jgi:hypothetical protein